MEFIVPRKYKETVDNYNQVELIYKDYKIEFRIYNDGVAYRFVSTANNKQPVKKESVSFRNAGSSSEIAIDLERKCIQ